MALVNSLENIYNYLQFSECIATAGQPSEEEIARIAQAGFQLVINLALTHSSYALEDEAGAVKAHGMSYVHIPVSWENPQRADLEIFFSVMDACQGKKIFIHCAANMRVSVFMALYRILKLGWTYQQAFEPVYQLWQPDETWQAFIDQNLQTAPPV